MMEKKRENRKKIIFQVHQDLHKEIKTVAAMCNISMSLLIHKALYQYLRKEMKELDNEYKLGKI